MTGMTTERIIKNIKRVMAIHGVTQDSLAKQLGVSGANISQKLKSDRNLSVANLFDITKILNVPLRFLMENLDDETDDNIKEMLIAYRFMDTQPFRIKKWIMDSSLALYKIYKSYQEEEKKKNPNK